MIDLHHHCTYFNRWLEDTAEDDYHFPLEAAAIREMFDQVAAKIIDKAKNVVSMAGKTPDKIILVGGLGSNPYLREKVRAAFTATLLAPAHGFAAILYGESTPMLSVHV